jgi:GrpB-like predicted nucleotidyltransferase (UPF0157 family)
VIAGEPLETGLIGGVKKVRIKLLDYDPYWPKKFQTHAGRIIEAPGDSALRIEHIGSTSVPGLAAKPIIDILGPFCAGCVPFFLTSIFFTPSFD